MTYKVKSGDTLSQIAAKHGIALSELLEANPRFKPNPNRVRVGDVLNVPGGTGPDGGGDAAAQAASRVPSKSTPPQPQPRASRVLGRLSVQYETGGRGCGTVSGGQGDPGGVSYGSYQMTCKPGGGTVKRFVGQADFAFSDRFSGLTAGSPEFTTAWKALAESNAAEFQECQHEYIKRTHFDPLVQKLIDEDDLNVLTRSHTLQDVIWSTAVQHGGGTDVPHAALAKVDLEPTDPGFDRAFITAIYEERGRVRPDGKLARFPRVSPQVQAGVANRFRKELEDALKMLDDEEAAR